MVKPDCTEEIDIRQSNWKMARLVLLGIGMTGLGLILAWPSLIGLDAGLFGQIIGWIGFLFFGACTAIIMWRAFTQRGAVITISPKGLHDSRVAKETILWHTIQDMYVWQMSGQKIIVVQIADELWDELTLSQIARRSRGANRALGVDGLAISTQGLQMETDQVFNIMIEMAERHYGAQQSP